MKNQCMFGILALIVLSQDAFAGAIADKGRQKDFMEAQKSGLSSANEACGAKFTASVEMSEYKAKEWEGMAPNCSEGLDALRLVCGESPDFKTAAVKHIKSFKCFPGSSASAQVTGSTLTYHVPPRGIMGKEKVAEIIKAAIDQ